VWNSEARSGAGMKRKVLVEKDSAVHDALPKKKQTPDPTHNEHIVY
jgi:hypothetical protein